MLKFKRELSCDDGLSEISQ